MKKKFFKCAKSALAVALAVVLAVPVTTMLTGTGVRAEEAFPQPIEVYNFDSADEVTMSATAVENAASIENDATRGNVFVYNEAIAVDVTAMGVITTKVSVGVTTDAAGVTSEVFNEITYEGVVVTDTYNINSSAEIKNPFYGRTDLTGDPAGFMASTGAPIWETGVTISYWQKTAGKGIDSDGTMLTFNSSRDNVIHKDDVDKYDLAQLYYADKTNPLFSLGEVKVMTRADLTKKGSSYYYNGIKVMGMTPATKEFKMYIGFGMFMRLNEEYTGDGYYFKPTLNTDGSIKQYSVTAIGDKLDLAPYKEIMSENSKIRYGTEEGCLTFMSSATWGFVEGAIGQDVKYYTNGKEVANTTGETRGLNRGNNCATYTYLLNGEDRVYQKLVAADETEKEALVNDTEWHYMTYVIKNDSISLYVDGVLQDNALYTNKTSAGVDKNKCFNLGWGYYSSGSEAGMIYEHNGREIFKNSEETIDALAENGDYVLYDAEGNPTLGHNGNTNSITLMEFITNNCTSLFLGEDGYNSDLTAFELEYGTAADNMIDSIAFFDQPLDGEQVAALYASVQTQDLESPNKPEPTPEPTPDITPGPTDVPTSGPVVTVEPTPGPTDVPTSGPSLGVMGDLNASEDVTLDDANLALKMALGIENPTEVQAVLGDVDEDGDITLDDANQILKAALGIINEFTKKTE